MPAMIIDMNNDIRFHTHTYTHIRMLLQIQQLRLSVSFFYFLFTESCKKKSMLIYNKQLFWLCVPMFYV
jgi:hypothetical protein